MTNVLWFIWSMILSYLPGITGWIYSPRAGEAAWYGTLTQSALTPAPWVFAVAWSILYFLLGCALYLIIRDRRSGQSKFGAYVLFGVHMVLNALWTYWFFGLHLVGLSLYVCAALVAVAIWMMRVFHGINRTAGNLVWPYVLWLVFATYLNAMVVYLN